jgi:hypothetical protein
MNAGNPGANQVAGHARCADPKDLRAMPSERIPEGVTPGRQPGKRVPAILAGSFKEGLTRSAP